MYSRYDNIEDRIDCCLDFFVRCLPSFADRSSPGFESLNVTIDACDDFLKYAFFLSAVVLCPAVARILPQRVEVLHASLDRVKQVDGLACGLQRRRHAPATLCCRLHVVGQAIKRKHGSELESGTDSNRFVANAKSRR